MSKLPDLPTPSPDDFMAWIDSALKASRMRLEIGGQQYGEDVLFALGEPGAIVNIYQKAARLLFAMKEGHVSKVRRDSYLDLAGFALLELARQAYLQQTPVNGLFDRPPGESLKSDRATPLVYLAGPIAYKGDEETYHNTSEEETLSDVDWRKEASRLLALEGIAAFDPYHGFRVPDDQLHNTLYLGGVERINAMAIAESTVVLVRASREHSTGTFKEMALCMTLNKPLYVWKDFPEPKTISCAKWGCHYLDDIPNLMSLVKDVNIDLQGLVVGQLTDFVLTQNERDNDRRQT